MLRGVVRLAVHPTIRLVSPTTTDERIVLDLFKHLVVGSALISFRNFSWIILVLLLLPNLGFLREKLPQNESSDFIFDATRPRHQRRLWVYDARLCRDSLCLAFSSSVLRTQMDTKQP